MQRILIVDDDEMLRELLRLHLESEGYSVQATAEPTEAIRAILNLVPDLVIADINMPYLSGLELLEAIRGDAISRSIPVIMLAACEDAGSLARALHLGANEYLTKPVQVGALLEAVRGVLSPQDSGAAMQLHTTRPLDAR
jgi:DNA-binding response OmpR family regulator